MRVRYQIGSGRPGAGPALGIRPALDAAPKRAASVSAKPFARKRLQGPAARSPAIGRKRLPVLGVTAALFAMAGCASLDPVHSQRWRIDPVLEVTHSTMAARGHYAVGRYHDGMRAWEKAAAEYRRAIAADSRHTEAHNALGVALARLGRHYEAELALRRAVQIEPQRAHLHSNLGYVLLQAGRQSEALVELKAAVKLDPDSATARGNLRQAVERWEASQAHTQTVAGAVHTSPVATGAVLAVPIGPVTDPARSAVSTGETAARPTPAGPSRALGEAAGAQIISVAAPITVANRAESFADIVQVPAPLATAAMAPQGVQVFDQPTVPAWPRAIAGAVYSAQEKVTPVATTPVALVAPALAATPTSPHEAQTDKAGLRQPAVRLELSNGNGVNGMAAQLGRWLSRQGVKTSRLTNQRPFVQERTVVEYRPGQEQAAWRVLQALPVATEAGPMLRDGLKTDVRVVLGQDWRITAVCMVRDDCPSAARVAATTIP